MKDAIVKITDNHITDGEKFICELTTTGSFGMQGGAYIISYDETDEELSGCVTTLRIEAPEKISMLRSGKYNTEMVFEKDRRHTCFYNTPIGELMMGIYARSVSSRLGEKGGTVKFAYTIDFNNDLVSENELTVFVRLRDAAEEDGKEE